MSYFTETIKVANILMYQLSILYMQMKLEETKIGGQFKLKCFRNHCKMKDQKIHLFDYFTNVQMEELDSMRVNQLYMFYA